MALRLAAPVDVHPLTPGLLALGLEDASGAGMSSPSSKATDITKVKAACAAGTVDAIHFIVRDSKDVLVGTHEQPGKKTFGGLWLEVNNGLDVNNAVTSFDDLLKVCRYEFRMSTGLMIAFQSGTDNVLQCRLSMPYIHLDFKNTVLCVVEQCDSMKSSFVNQFPYNNGFLQFVSLEQFANADRFPKDTRSTRYDMEKLYTMDGYADFPVCRFVPEEVKATTAAPRTESDQGLKRGQIPKFYGYGERRTPKDFDMAEYLEKVTRMLENVSPKKQYSLFVEALQDGKAYSYVQAYEKSKGTADKIFTELRDKISAISPVEKTEGRDDDQYKRLKLTDFDEEAWIDFDREYVRLADKVGGKGDITRRREYFEKLPSRLRSLLVKDRLLCPSDPIKEAAVHPQTGAPFTFAMLQEAAKTIMRIEQQDKLLNKPAGSNKRSDPDGSTDEPERKLSKKQRKLNAQSRKLESAANGANADDFGTYPKAERVKAGAGKNGVFRDGSPKTCNNCNGNDHFTHECKKPTDTRAKFEAKHGGNASSAKGGKADTVNNLADSNLSKKAKKDIKALLMGASEVPVPVNPATVAGAAPRNDNAALAGVSATARSTVSLNGQSTPARGQVSSDRIFRLCNGK